MDTLPNVIAFSGGAGTGKDTSAAIVMEYLKAKGISYQHLKFAGKLKDVLSVMWDVPVQQLYTNEGKAIYIAELDQTMGKLHQTVGDAMRSIHPEIWIHPVTKKFNKDIITVISDCRFPLEITAVHNANNHTGKGIVVRIEREQD